jgi:AcrR family transcriptional regulator
VARELFGDEGYDATSVAEIARRVGVVEGAIYRHFPSKRDLLHQVIRSFYEPLIESATVGVAAIESPRERVRFLIRRQLEAMAHDPLLCRLIISEARSFDDYYESEVAELSRRYTSLFVDAYRDGVGQGLFRDDVPAGLVRDMVYGSIEHLAWSALSGHRSIDLDTTTDQLLSVVCGGIVRLDEQPSDGSLEADLRKLETVAERLDQLSASLQRPKAGSR